MTSRCMSIAQTVSYKLCATEKRFSSSSFSPNNFLSFPIIHKSSSNRGFQLYIPNSNQNFFKHHTRAITSGPGEETEDKEEDNEEDFKVEHEDDKDIREKDDDKEVFGAEDDDREDYRAEDDDKEVFGSEDDDKEDYRAEETVLKLYNDIKNRNIEGISEVIGDDCQCFSNIFSTYRMLQGKKQVMAFFYWLMMKLGKDIKIIVKPTSKDGMTIGVQWQLEWEKPHIQLGKGFSFHICHIYQGRLLIKNVEMFMEPIFHMEHLRLRTMAFAVGLAEKIVTYLRPAENTRRQAMSLLLLALLLLAATAFYFTRPRF